jgi:hypothetical protein
MRGRSGARIAGVAMALGLAVAACASGPRRDTARLPAPAVLTTPEAAGVRDLRAVYRAALCPRLEAAGRSCDEVLVRAAGEPLPGPAVPPASDLGGRYRVAFVAGFLAECLEPRVTPFGDVLAALREAGVEARLLRVAGRGRTADNAEQLARQIDALPADSRPLILVAYSKGLPDTLELLVHRPDIAARVAAVLSLAGASTGSPLADRYGRAYRRWVAGLPLSGCDKGTGAEIDDLRRDVRLDWWRRHGAAVTVPIFALVTMPARAHVSPVLRPAYRALARVDPRNDGNLVWYDQVPPRSRLLGYLDADHWTVAIPFAQALPLGDALFHDTVPRPLVIDAALTVIDASLRSAGG